MSEGGESDWQPGDPLYSDRIYHMGLFTFKNESFKHLSHAAARWSPERGWRYVTEGE